MNACDLCKLLRPGPERNSVGEMRLVVTVAKTESELAAALGIRHAVFVVEQGVPAGIDVDGLDGECLHFIARQGDRAVATARARTTPKGWKIERVAVLVEQRGQGVGTVLVRRVLEDSPAGASVYVHAQRGALAFWESLGFVAHGPGFDEGGIPHRLMLWQQR